MPTALPDPEFLNSDPDHLGPFFVHACVMCFDLLMLKLYSIFGWTYCCDKKVGVPAQHF